MTLTNCYTYDGSGRVTGVFRIDELTFRFMRNRDKSVRRGVASPEQHYVERGHLIDRPASPATLRDSFLENVPAGSSISLLGQVFVCEEGGRVELDIGIEGQISIVVECWPYLDGEFVFENINTQKLSGEA